MLVACTSSGSTYGQLQTLEDLAKHTPSQSAAITVGVAPYAIDITYFGKIYVANRGDGTVSVISALNDTKIGKDIKVGEGPNAIGVDQSQHKVYVTNSYDSTVSVINSTSDTNIRKDIKVGGNPSAIGFDNGKAYVANTATGTVSVIALRNDTKIGKDIKVGKGPSGIGVDNNLYPPKVYVANTIDGTVSVINSKNDTKIGKDIKVGKGPIGIGVFSNLLSTHILYVANSFDNTVSVIEETTNKVVAAVTFSVKPFNAGHIECGKDRLIAPVGQQFYINSSSECTARPNQGFDFVSWQENLGGNSSRVIQFATQPPFYEPILNALGLAPDKPEATLNITKFGSFTLNFKATPPPIPPEYVATLFSFVITVLVGSLLIPAIIRWFKSKRQTSRLNLFHQKIHGGKNIDKLNTSLNEISDAYTEGKISNEQYTNLRTEISVLYEEIYKKRIDSADGNGALLDEVKEDVKDAYGKEKISEKHYKLLIERICDSSNNQQSAAKPNQE